MFTAEFREEAIALIERSASQRLGGSVGALHQWYMAEMARKKGRRPTTATPSAQAAQGESDKSRAARLERENAKLHRRVAQLEQDRAILRKAAAFFARESE